MEASVVSWTNGAQHGVRNAIEEHVRAEDMAAAESRTGRTAKIVVSSSPEQ
jgi:hypothetical protein